MWLPDVITSTPAASRLSAVDAVRPIPPATFSPLAVTKSMPAFLAELAQDRLHGDPAGLADQVPDHQDPAGTRRPRDVAVGRIAEARPADRMGRAVVAASYFAYSTARVSRMTVTLIWPG